MLSKKRWTQKIVGGKKSAVGLSGVWKGYSDLFFKRLLRHEIVGLMIFLSLFVVYVTIHDWCENVGCFK